MSSVLKDKDEYKIIIELHNIFAKAIKQLELEFTNSYFIPSNNEMRYAMRGLIDFLSYDVFQLEDPEKKHEAFIRCKHALLCGYHDLLDIAIGIMKNDLNESIKDFGLKNLILAFPTYNEYGVFLDDISRKIINTRSQSKEFDRNEIYNDMLSDYNLDKMIEEYQKFKHALPSAKLLKRRSRIKDFISILGLLLGLIIGIIGLIF